MRHCTAAAPASRKVKDGAVEALRVLRVTRAHAVRERRSALQLLRMMIVSALEEVREQVRHLTRMQLIRTLAAWRPDVADASDPITAYRVSMKSLARRYLELTDEVANLDQLINPIIEALAPNSWNASALASLRRLALPASSE